MKRFLMILVLFFFMIMISIGSLFGCMSYKNSYKSKQENLAQELGVSIKDYPYETSFPLGYFDVTLKPGMSVNEVHQIVQGFAKVYRCKTPGNNPPGKYYYYSEIYYFFSTEDAKATRLQIFYDEHEYFKRFESEDEDSRTIRLNGCELGVIPEPGN